MKPNQRKTLQIAGLFLRIHLFYLNSKLYSKLLKETKSSELEENTLGTMMHLMSRSIFEADRAQKLVMQLLITMSNLSENSMTNSSHFIGERPVLSILDCIDVVKIKKYLMERTEETDDINHEVKFFVPDFGQLANIACRALKNYLKVHRNAGYYKESFTIVIPTLLKLYTATGNYKKLSKLIAVLPDYLPFMNESLPKVNGKSTISMFNFEFNDLAYELQKLGQMQPEQKLTNQLQTSKLIWPLFNLQ